jgi:hypothetical protein
MKKLKPFLSLKKVRDWYHNNRPDLVLLAAFDDYTIPVRVVDDGVEQDVYLEIDLTDSSSQDGLSELEVEIIDDLKFKAMIRQDYEDPNSQKYVRIFTQPEKDAWIIWKEVDEDESIPK